MDFVRLDRADTVVTATRSLSPGSEVERIAIRSAIPSGHKVATQAMAAGDPVRKYAQIIGYASCEFCQVITCIPTTWPFAILIQTMSSQQIYARWHRPRRRIISWAITKSEAQGLGDYEFVPWQIGAVM